MAERAPRVGVVDSGLPEALAARVVAARAFVAGPEGGASGTVVADRLGHGSAIAGIIAGLAPQAHLLNAQVFGERLATTPSRIATAIDWLVDEGAELINLSLGLAREHPALAHACERALAAGVVLCAATPARGGPVWPAAIPGVLRMTGDARCAVEEISHLATAQADFGGHVRAPAGVGPSVIAGASVGCAHLSGHIARLLSVRPANLAEVRARLVAQARYHGPERRTG